VGISLEEGGMRFELTNSFGIRYSCKFESMARDRIPFFFLFDVRI
jgi:hypothetical protein